MVQRIVGEEAGETQRKQDRRWERRVSSLLTLYLPLVSSVPLVLFCLRFLFLRLRRFLLETRILSLPETTLLSRFLLKTRIKTDEAEERTVSAEELDGAAFAGDLTLPNP